MSAHAMPSHASPTFPAAAGSKGSQSRSALASLGAIAHFGRNNTVFAEGERLRQQGFELTAPKDTRVGETSRSDK